MTTPPSPDDVKQDLLDRIDAAWSQLNATVAQFSEADLITKRDAGGWSGKDHLAHTGAWERSMVYLLQGKPRYEGLGVPEALYLADDTDAVNDVIHRAHRESSLADVNQWRHEVHDQMVTILTAIPALDLFKTYSDFLPDEPGTETGDPIYLRIGWNTIDHFPEHGGYITRIASEGA